VCVCVCVCVYVYKHMCAWALKWLCLEVYDGKLIVDPFLHKFRTHE